MTKPIQKKESLSMKRKSRVSNNQYSVTNREFVSSLFPEDYGFNVNHVFEVMPITYETMVSKTRVKDVTHWRQIVTVYNFMSGLSLEETGKEVEKDHATVLHSIRCIVYAMQGFDNRLKEKIDQVLEVTTEGIYSTRDQSLNELISLSFLESQILEKFPILAQKNCSFSIGYSG